MVAEIRPLRAEKDLAACVELQQALWGPSDTVPTSVLALSEKIGGIAAGAFSADDLLLGFVFGLPGVRKGKLVHWSHILAVRPEARDRGIGRRLKLHQRARLADQGIEWIYWTFDPLVSRNAFFNLERLGAEVEEYVVNMYPTVPDNPTDSVIGTDRFIVRWRVLPTEEAPSDRGGRGAESGTPIVNLEDPGRLPPAPGEPFFCNAPMIRIAVPRDIQSLKLEQPDVALRWREGTRKALVEYLARGYRVTGFEPPDSERGYGCYLLARSEKA